MRRRVAAGAVLATLVGAGLAFLGLAYGQQVHRNGFETRTVAWSKGAADAAFREAIHEVTDQTAHTGQFAEHLQLSAEVGSYIYYYYPTGRAPIGDELSTSLWVKANRPGMQLMARVVMPREHDPNHLDEPLTTLIRGDIYQLAGRWQRLEIRHPVKLIHDQQQLMRAELKRDVNITDAFIDQLTLNVYGGPGLTELWIDDLEVGPVLDASPFQTTSRPTGTGAPKSVDLNPGKAIPSRAAVVELNQDHLLVGGKRFFFRGIRHSDTPLKALRDAGFNTVWFDYATPVSLMEEAVNRGFWLVPSLPISGNDPRLSSPDSVGEQVAHFLEGDAVLFWDLGGGLTIEQAPLVEQAARVIHGVDAQRPLGGDVWDGFLRYSRNLELLGVHRWPLMTGLELTGYLDWLDQRRRLARPGTFAWTWVQTHLPDWFTNLVYDQPGAKGFQEPIGPQPEQIRLLTYAALAAGCRGIGFWSDRFLADSHQGRDRLLALALLNQELQMLEPLLVSVVESPNWIETSNPEVKAAVLRTEKGMLVLPIWLGKGAQYVPGQEATVKLSIVVPQVPTGAQAWELSPGDVYALPIERVVGGTKVTVPEFSLTTAIVFTSDNGPNGLVVRLQDQTRRMRRTAAQWAHDLAEVEIEKVMKIEDELERGQHTLPDGKALADNARARLKNSVEFWNSGDYRQAYAEAQRALRPLRIMMRAQWEQATRGLETPVASPYAVSYFTLPRHWQFMDQIQRTTVGANVLPDGDFEVSPERAPSAWTAQEISVDQVDLIARRVEDQPREGQQCLMLQIKPRNLTGPDGKPLPPPPALERTFLAINSPAVHLTPGSLVRVSAWVKVPNAIASSADGALFYDSAGGEPLAVRLTAAETKWRKFTLYRRVPASGAISVTLALTGLGTVYFDDVRIEPLLTNASAARKP